MAYYSKEEIYKAKQMDLFTYLSNFEPNELVHESRNNYHTMTHDSLKISNGMWYWFSRGVGGKSALDYLITVEEYTFTDAMKKILGYSNESIKTYHYERKENKYSKLQLPEKNTDDYKVIQYLMKRGINRDIILECINKDLIYEDKNHNVVFVGYDEKNNPKYGSIRGTSDTRYMKEAYGSNKEYSFKLANNPNSNSIHLFESAIDLLSYATIIKDYKLNYHDHNLLSLGGVFQPGKDGKSKVPVALEKYLENHKNINRIVLHLDNDSAGRFASNSIKENLKNDYEIIDSPPRFGKDVNDFLVMTKQNQVKEKEMER